MKQIIRVEGLAKSYGDVEAVKGIDFSVDQGTLFAFLGPNGAGKSTTIDMVTTLLRPDSGTITIDGHAVGKEDTAIRDIIGIVFQDNLLDNLLTVKENLMLRGSFYGLKGREADEAVSRVSDAVGIGEFLNRQYGKLSGGQRRRADIARALINTPRILFLDEPTTGLDPQTRKNVWDTIRHLQKENGVTVFLTTHYMEEAAEADYVTIIDHGEILTQGTPLQLRTAHSTDTLRIAPKNNAAFLDYLSERQIPFSVNGSVYEIELENTVQAIPIVEGCKQNIENVEIVNGTMDDVFLNITGRELREA